MKKFLSIVLMITALVISNQALADSHASARNKCKNGKRYKTKVKVNGPNGCAREVYKDNNCSSSESEAVLYRDPSCVCQGSTWSPVYTEGAYAYALANGNGLTSISYKTTACNGWKAGGNLFNQNIATPYPRPEGKTKVELSSKELVYNYEANTIQLKTLKGELSTQSTDLLNEFGLFQITISLIDPVKSDVDKVIETLYFAQVSLKDGKLFFTGSNNFLTSSDFDYKNNGSGLSYTLKPGHRQIQLTKDITEDMLIEVTLTSDVGNLQDGRSEVEVVDTKLTTEINVVSNNIKVKIQSNKDTSGDIEVYDQQGFLLKRIQNTSIQNSIDFYTELDRTDFINKGQYFLVIFRESTGEISSDNFTVNQ
jgi:hypothetical protein